MQVSKSPSPLPTLKLQHHLLSVTQVPAQHHLPAAHPLCEGAHGTAPGVCGCLGKESVQEPWPGNPASLRWPVPGHWDAQNHPRATGTPSCPLTHHCAGIVLPIMATLHQNVLGSRGFSPCEALAPPDSPCTGKGKVWGTKSLSLLSWSCQ